MDATAPRVVGGGCPSAWPDASHTKEELDAVQSSEPSQMQNDEDSRRMGRQTPPVAAFPEGMSVAMMLLTKDIVTHHRSQWAALLSGAGVRH